MKSKTADKLFWMFYLIVWFIMVWFIMMWFLPSKCHASTIEIKPSVEYASQGQEFYARVFVIPSTINYTVNMRMMFSGAELVDWHTSKYWMELPVKYYWEDYAWGISRTAGYPGGFSSRTYFGTAYFKAKRDGLVDIKLKNDSLILNGSNINDITIN